MKKHSFKQLHSFLLLWGSQTVSQLGTAMTDYAVIIWVYSQRRTASSVTLLTVCTFLPTIFFRFLAKPGNDGMLSPFILGRMGNNKSVPGTGESFTAPGVLADTVFEPLMGTDSQIQRMLSGLFGTGKEPASD